MSIIWKNKCFYINFCLQIPMWLIVYNTQNSFAPQMKNVKLRWGKKKIFKMFECPGSALLIDTNFTYEKSRYPFQLKSMFLWTFTNDLSWILLIDACTKNIFYCKYWCIFLLNTVQHFCPHIFFNRKLKIIAWEQTQCVYCSGNSNNIKVKFIIVM